MTADDVLWCPQTGVYTYIPAHNAHTHAQMGAHIQKYKLCSQTDPGGIPAP